MLKDTLRRALGSGRCIKEEDSERKKRGRRRRNEAKQDLGFSGTKTDTVLFFFFSNLKEEQFFKERLAKKGNLQAL